MTWQWGELYRDTDMIKFAIGRFLYDMKEDVYSSVLGVSRSEEEGSQHLQFQPYSVKRLKSKLYARSVCSLCSAYE